MSRTHANPAGGGSYRRNHDGSLTAVEAPTASQPGKTARRRAAEAAAKAASPPTAAVADTGSRRGHTSTKSEG
jgi:hypothetical protein